MRVAVVAPGLGLAAAAELRRAGIGVTLYDAHERAGGLGDHGIVPWRLPRETVALEVEQVERAGVRFSSWARSSGGTWSPRPWWRATTAW